MQSWIRRVEQQVSSLDKRLDAIERRLSEAQGASPPVRITGGEPPRISEETVGDEKKGGETGAAPTVYPVANPSRTLRTEGMNLANLERRVKRLEGERVLFSVGGLQVPVEVTGMAAGILALVLAGLLHFGYMPVAASRLFMAILGTVLVLTSTMRAYTMNDTQK
ncbi:MAG: hypothetical protein PHU95_06620 [Candidatus Thermoplasmatota archaeon]|nr:hypothetical protein [Candidatus Thermoplasmatota archaeon]